MLKVPVLVVLSYNINNHSSILVKPETEDNHLQLQEYIKRS